MTRSNSRWPASAAGLLFLLAPVGAQTVWHVAAGAPAGGDGSPGSPFNRIQDAIDAAAPSGDEALVQSGDYFEHIDLLGKGLLVEAVPGPNPVVLHGNGTQSVVTLVRGEGPATILRGLVIQSGWGTPGQGGYREGGGARLVGASARFEHCEFSGHVADLGGAIHVVGGAPVFDHCSIHSNTAKVAGGVYVEGAAARFLDCEISYNTGGVGAPGLPNQGGGLLINGGLPGMELVRTTVAHNRADIVPDYPYGVGIFVDGALTMRNCTIRDNLGGTGVTGASTSGGYGIGLFVSFFNDEPVVVEDCLFEGNRWGYSGGAIFMVGQNLTVRRTTFRGNAAGGGGAVRGGIYEDCRFEGNTAEFGPVLQAAGGAVDAATLTRCHIEGNRCVGPALGGGGAFQTLLTDCLVLANDAGQGEGGGLLACVATDCEIVGNRAMTGGGVRGGTATRCRFRGNEATLAGGAASGDASLVHCEILGNRAPEGAVVHHASLQFCTATHNVSAPGNSVISGQAGFIRNSILHGNLPAALGGSASAFQFEYCLLEVPVPGAGNLVGDPLFLGPASGDLRLSPGSPAIDAADLHAPFDPDGTPAEIGALPYDRMAVFSYGAYCSAKVNSVGCLPALSATGEPTLTGLDDFVLEATELIGGSFAIVTVGTRATATPLAGGLVCVGTIQVRLPLTPTGGSAGTCDGAAQFHVSHAMLGQLGVGTLGYAQAFFRDASHPDGTGLAMTQGVEFRVRN